jgi:hypothetical protein
MCSSWQAGLVVAQTTPKERADTNNGLRWATYRVRRIDAAEHQLLRVAGTVGQFAPFQPFVLEVQRTKTEGSQVDEGNWEFWASGDSPEAVINEMLGDTSFLEAQSLHPLHAELVAATRELREAQDQEYSAERRMKAAHQVVQDFKDEKNRAYAAKIAGITDEDKVREIGKRMLASALPRLEELRREATEADAAFRVATKKAEQLRARDKQLSHRTSGQVSEADCRNED